MIGGKAGSTVHGEGEGHINMIGGKAGSTAYGEGWINSPWWTNPLPSSLRCARFGEFWLFYTEQV